MMEPADAPPPAERTKYRILVVDDDPDIARFNEVNLLSAGYEVSVAYDGEECLASVAEELPDLVLLDVMMPRIDGFEVLRRLRSDPRTQDLVIVMCTAKALHTDLLIALAAGADDYVIKPFDPIDILERVRTALAGSAEMLA